MRGFGTVKRSLIAYRIMAFITGVVLLSGTVILILQQFPSVGISQTEFGFLWVAHGYLFIAYVLTTLNLGLHFKWSPVRIALTAVAGTVPSLSFVAERNVVHNLEKNGLAAKN